MMSVRITAVAAQKGGTTKTAIAVNVAPMLAWAGQRTLLIDLDQQSDATRRFGHTAKTLDHSVVDVLAPAGNVPAADAIVRDVRGVTGLDLLASDVRAAGLEDTLAGQRYRERRLKQALTPVLANYDEIVIDCPPSLSTLTLNGLVAATRAVVPVNMQDESAIAGMEQLLETVQEIQSQEKEAVVLAAVVLNRVKPASRAYRANKAALEPFAQAGIPFAATELRESAAYHNAGANNLPLVLSAPNSDASRNFRLLMQELWPDLRFPYMSEIANCLSAELRATRRLAVA